MEASTTIQQMMAGNKIFVPTYQRAYSWDTEFDHSKTPKQVNVFLSDLEEYNKSSAKSPYYFGHFLFEEIDKKTFGVVDGQQRLTTIVIFLSALFKRLESIRSLSKSEEDAKEEMVAKRSTHRFETVNYDKQLFKDYVVNQTKKDHHGLETQSARRMVDAFDFFNKHFETKDEDYLVKMLETVSDASCSTHPVQDESEAIQMFILQNNRGKKPSNLEIIKAQFMYNVHLYGGEEKEYLIEEIKERFEKIYKSISSIEYRISEDDVLLYTLRVYFNSLWESNPVERIGRLLAQPDSLSFISKFTQSLAVSFEHLTTFFGENERSSIEIHALVTLGRIGIVMPFIIKAYIFGLSVDNLNTLCRSFESIVLRHRLIGTRADITSRLNDVYWKFTSENPDIQPVVGQIDWMKTTDNYWGGHWNNSRLEDALQSGINHWTAKYLLWKYENHLEGLGKSGYMVTRYDKIISPELEHIAPKTENPESGYDSYDEEFRNDYIECLGNYLLLSKSHNCSVGNKPFAEKRNSYNHLEQQREIQRMTEREIRWTKELIQSRKEKIIKFLMATI